MMRNRMVIYIPIVLAVVLAFGIYIGATLRGGDGAKGKDYFSISYSRFNKLNEIINYVENEYVDSVDKARLVDHAIQNLLQELDPHSYYITAEERRAYEEPLEGNFEGVGIQFSIQKDTVVVISPVAGGPSEKVGILSGDRIVEVEGKLIAGNGVTNDKVMSLLRGKAGTEVKVGIKRYSKKGLLDFTIERGTIPLHSVESSYMLTDDIAYIKISRFSKNTHEEFSEAGKKLLEKGMKSLVIDLRGNGGGYLEAATDVADELLEKGKLIVYTEGRARPRESYVATEKGMLEDIELAILIDEGSASASEILAGALQDNDKGIVIGRRSFGKGLVQEQSSWPDGSATRLTTARYYTPTGRCIQTPYEEGTKAYHQLQADRISALGFEDSVSFPDSLKFTTPGGRVVYGGGGITPDVEVQPDTSGASFYLAELSYRGLINQFAFQHVDKNRKSFEKYSDFEQFNSSFTIDGALMNEFIAYADSTGTKVDTAGLEASRIHIETRLKAFMARNLWSNEGFYQVINKTDITIKKAIELLNKS